MMSILRELLTLIQVRMAIWTARVRAERKISREGRVHYKCFWMSIIDGWTRALGWTWGVIERSFFSCCQCLQLFQSWWFRLLRSSGGGPCPRHGPVGVKLQTMYDMLSAEKTHFFKNSCRELPIKAMCKMRLMRKLSSYVNSITAVGSDETF